MTNPSEFYNLPVMDHYKRYLFTLRLSLLAAFAILVAPAPGAAQEGVAVQPPVVIELFSSQACTFCPPADKFLGQLVQQQGIIGLSCHVDYFDVKQGSMSKKFCTQRQTNYIKKLKVPAHYTPQMVVNGHMDVIGYEADKVSAAILKARSERIDRVNITRQESDNYGYTINARDLKGEPVHVWLAIFDKPHEKTVQDGGNRGKRVTYYNVVSRLTDLGSWDGAAQTQYLKPFMTADNAGFAVLVQNDTTGNIIAAGAIYNQ
jgi:hypothetical protein